MELDTKTRCLYYRLLVLILNGLTCHADGGRRVDDFGKDQPIEGEREVEDSLDHEEASEEQEDAVETGQEEKKFVEKAEPGQGY